MAKGYKCTNCQNIRGSVDDENRLINVKRQINNHPTTTWLLVTYVIENISKSHCQFIYLNVWRNGRRLRASSQRNYSDLCQNLQSTIVLVNEVKIHKDHYVVWALLRLVSSSEPNKIKIISLLTNEFTMDSRDTLELMLLTCLWDMLTILVTNHLPNEMLSTMLQRFDTRDDRSHWQHSDPILSGSHHQSNISIKPLDNACIVDKK